MDGTSTICFGIAAGSVLLGLVCSVALHYFPIAAMFAFFGSLRKKKLVLHGPQLPTVDDACRIVETNPARLANKKSFRSLMSLYSEEQKVHLHLLQKATSLIEAAAETASSSDTAAADPDGDPSPLLLWRSIIKNTFPFFPKQTETPIAPSNPQWDTAADELSRCHLWDHRDVVLAWFGEGGLPILHSFIGNGKHSQIFKQILPSDEEIFLLIAEHCVPSRKRFCFKFSYSTELRTKKSFVREVVRKDPSLFFCVPLFDFGRCSDHELDTASLFFASATTWTDFCLHGCAQFKKQYPEFLMQLRDYLREKILPLYAFQQLDQPSSPLKKLDDHLWNEISQFVGLQPDSKQFQVYQSAERNLLNYLNDEALQQRERELEWKYNRLRARKSWTHADRCFKRSCDGW